MGETSARRRIVHVVESALAGVGRHVIDLGRGQARLGHDVHVVFSPVREDERFRTARCDETEVTFHELAIHRNPNLADLRARSGLRQIFSELEPEVIHAHSSKAGLLVRSIPRAGHRVLYTPHAMITLNPDLSPVQRRVAAAIERALARRTDVIIAVSAHELDHLHTIGIDPARTRLVPNGIDPVDPRPVSEEVRAELGLPIDPPIVGFVGRLVPQKNPEALLAALAHLDPDVHLAFVGEGPLRADLERKASAVAARVHLLGEVHGPRAMFGFDCLAVPSRYESAPYVALEAADAGIPVVSALPVPGSADWAGAGAVAAPSLSAADLGAAIRRGLSAPRPERLAGVRTIEMMVADIDGLLWSGGRP